MGGRKKQKLSTLLVKSGNVPSIRVRGNEGGVDGFLIRTRPRFGFLREPEESKRVISLTYEDRGEKDRGFDIMCGWGRRYGGWYVQDGERFGRENMGGLETFPDEFEKIFSNKESTLFVYLPRETQLVVDGEVFLFKKMGLKGIDPAPRYMPESNISKEEFVDYDGEFVCENLTPRGEIPERFSNIFSYC